MIAEQYNEIIKISAKGANLTGELIIPKGSESLVIFSHGSGSSRLSPRNKFVATKIQKLQIGTLLFDLLTPDEDADFHNRFDIDLLTDRLVQVTNWAGKNLWKDGIQRIGYFGSSTGAGSALKAASVLGENIKAIVSRGGRPDLALRELPEVTAAVRLIVGGYDQPVIGMNEVAYNALHNVKDKDLNIVPGASHLFEETGKLEEVADLANEWFKRYL